MKFSPLLNYISKGAIDYSYSEHTLLNCKTRWDETRQDKTKRDKRKRNKTRRGKPRQKKDRTKQDKTRQNQAKFDWAKSDQTSQKEKKRDTSCGHWRAQHPKKKDNNFCGIVDIKQLWIQHWRSEKPQRLKPRPLSACQPNRKLLTQRTLTIRCVSRRELFYDAELSCIIKQNVITHVYVHSQYQLEWYCDYWPSSCSRSLCHHNRH